MTKLEMLQAELISLLKDQIVDLTMMSKIELGDDVIAEINGLQDLMLREKFPANVEGSSEFNQAK